MEEREEKLYQQLKQDAEQRGYYLNPDVAFTKQLLAGMLKNQDRYGYLACPCRLASGEKEEDLDIVCPCDYRDPDLHDFEMCYCGLYVSQKVVRVEEEAHSIPDRRPPEGPKKNESTRQLGTLPLPVYRCKVCGYLCAREHPPESCPICKVPADRFERFI